jgi:SAM-dependent methyltransferase
MNHWFLERALARHCAGRAGRPPPRHAERHRHPAFLPRRTRLTSVVASDLSPAMIAQAQRKARRSRRARGHPRAAVQPDTFDAVVCSRFIMHLPRGARSGGDCTPRARAVGPVIATVCHP